MKKEKQKHTCIIISTESITNETRKEKKHFFINSYSTLVAVLPVDAFQTTTFHHYDHHRRRRRHFRIPMMIDGFQSVLFD